DAEQDLGDAPTAPRERIVRPEAQPIEQEAAEERVAVGVEAAGREADELVPRLHAVRARTAVLLDHADDETGEVVLTRRVEVRHLGRLAAEQRAAVGAAARRNTRHDLLDRPRLEPAH